MAIYHQAQQFYFAGLRCLWEVPIAPRTHQYLPVAAAVNLLLSAELSLKAAAARAGLRPKRTHSLKALLEEVPSDYVIVARALFGESAASSTFDEAVEFADGQFVAVRYLYESDNLNEPTVIFRHEIVALAEALFLAGTEAPTSRS